MKQKKILAGLAAALVSSGAMAGNLTGNVGAVSDYMFRGIDQTTGAAVQGGVDYGWDIGAYAGAWTTNSLARGGNEADVYGGYGIKLGPVDLDAGLIYYAFSEGTEGVSALSHNYNWGELYVGGTWGPASLKVFYTNDFGPDTLEKNKQGVYATSSVLVTLNETVSLTPQLGFSSGKGVKEAFGKNYLDYSLTATKKLKDDLSVSVAIVGTDLKQVPGGSPNHRDDPKFIIGVKKNFAI